MAAFVAHVVQKRPGKQDGARPLTMLARAALRTGMESGGVLMEEALFLLKDVSKREKEKEREMQGRVLGRGRMESDGVYFSVEILFCLIEIWGGRDRCERRQRRKTTRPLFVLFCFLFLIIFPIFSHFYCLILIPYLLPIFP